MTRQRRGRGQSRRRISAGVAASGSAVLVGILAAVVVLLLLSDSPIATLRSFVLRPFSNAYFFGNMVSSAGYLLLAALGIVVSFRANLYNLGGDGQIYLGALAGTLVALALPDAPGLAGQVLILTAAASTGAALAGLAGVLKLIWDTPELITTYLVSAALVPAATFYVTGPGRDAAGNLLATPRVSESYWLAELLPPSELNSSVLIALLLAVVTAVVLFRTLPGYELRMYGANAEFARYAGIRTEGVVIGALSCSGALHGLTGGLMVLGTFHATISEFSLGLGWTAITVALVGRLHPLGAIVSALLFSYLEAGAQMAMLETGFTFELGAVVQALILLFVTAEVARGFLERRNA
ncbi:MAG: ABC transporter permease [Spirochaetales bacterium]